MIRPFDIWACEAVASGADLNGQAAAVSAPFRRIVDYLAGLPDPAARFDAWQAIAETHPDRDEIVEARARVDPTGPPPEAEATRRTATLADVRGMMSASAWPWPGWLCAGTLNALAADPGTGKTIMAADLARRLWIADTWPDQQANPFPERTRTLWVPGDRHYMQLIDLAASYGLPDDALLFNAPADDPTAGIDLDDPATLAELAGRIEVDAPGLVIVDTVGMTTDRNLCRAEDAKAYFAPLLNIAVRTRALFLLLTHLSKEGGSLGRRIDGACRVVWKMTDPDPEARTVRRRVWVDKTFAAKPAPMGMTIGEAGCTFDFSPPSKPEASKGGRPPEARDKARSFIVEALNRENDRIGNELCEEWESKQEGSEKTFWRAVKALAKSGELTMEGGPGTGKQTALHLNRTDSEADPGTVD
jgi:hypothetical protein